MNYKNLANWYTELGRERWLHGTGPTGIQSSGRRRWTTVKEQWTKRQEPDPRVNKAHVKNTSSSGRGRIRLLCLIIWLFKKHDTLPFHKNFNSDTTFLDAGRTGRWSRPCWPPTRSTRTPRWRRRPSTSPPRTAFPSTMCPPPTGPMLSDFFGKFFALTNYLLHPFRVS